MQQQQQQQNPSALVPPPPPPQQLNNPQSSSSSAAATSLRSPPSATAAATTHSPLSVAPVPPPHRQPLLSSLPLPPDHAVGPVVPVAAALPSGGGDPALTAPAVVTCPLARVRLSDIAPYDGAPAGPYVRAVEALSGSLMRHNAALIELGSEDSALMRCGLEGARLFFRSRAQLGVGKGSRGVYMYRAGRYEVNTVMFILLCCF